jgi:hypothetical protein
MNDTTSRIAAVVFALLPTLAWGGGEAPPGMSAQARAALVKEAPKGPEFRSSGQAYRIVGGLRATTLPPGDSVERGLSAVRSAPGDLVERKGPYLIFREPVEQGAGIVPSARDVDRSRTLPVAVNLRTGRLGVVANVLVVKLKDVGAAQELATANGLALTFVASGIGYAFFDVPDDRDLLAAASAVARDARVKSAEVEVRENFNVPR